MIEQNTNNNTQQNKKVIKGGKSMAKITMRIMVNPEESYSMDFTGGDISLEEFKRLAKKMSVVVSFLDRKDTYAQQTHEITRKPRPREEIIEILSTVLKNPIASPIVRELLEKKRISIATIQQNKYKWIERYNITATDLGLTGVLPKSNYGWSNVMPEINNRVNERNAQQQQQTQQKTQPQQSQQQQQPQKENINDNEKVNVNEDEQNGSP